MKRILLALTVVAGMALFSQLGKPAFSHSDDDDDGHDRYRRRVIEVDDDDGYRVRRPRYPLRPRAYVRPPVVIYQRPSCLVPRPDYYSRRLPLGFRESGVPSHPPRQRGFYGGPELRARPQTVIPAPVVPPLPAPRSSAFEGRRGSGPSLGLENLPAPAAPAPHSGPFLPQPGIVPGSAVPHAEVAVIPQIRAGQFVNFEVPLIVPARIKDRKNIAPHAVHRVVAIKNTSPLGGPEYVFVDVLVPPIPARRVSVSHGGAALKLNYGKYEVEVGSVRGYVVVDYDD